MAGGALRTCNKEGMRAFLERPELRTPRPPPYLPTIFWKAGGDGWESACDCYCTKRTRHARLMSSTTFAFGRMPAAAFVEEEEAGGFSSALMLEEALFTSWCHIEQHQHSVQGAPQQECLPFQPAPSLLLQASSRSLSLAQPPPGQLCL